MGVTRTGPVAQAAVARLREWAVTKGNAVFAWGTPGDFLRCQKFYREKGMPGRMIDGWCANCHRLATGGFMPGHAPSEGGDGVKPKRK